MLNPAHKNKRGETLCPYSTRSQKQSKFYQYHLEIIFAIICLAKSGSERLLLSTATATFVHHLCKSVDMMLRRITFAILTDVLNIPLHILSAHTRAVNLALVTCKIPRSGIFEVSQALFSREVQLKMKEEVPLQDYVH